MVSVTQRVSKVKQPRGGYIRPRDFEEIVLSDGIELHPEENLHANLVGMAVDYLTRYLSGSSAEEAFEISLSGSFLVGEDALARSLVQEVNGLDDQSIRNACKLVGYDVCVRAGTAMYKPVEEICADDETVSNIRTMVSRSLAFWEEFGPIVKDSFTFEFGYTEEVSTGDGDYLTEDTLWDFKLSKNGPTNKHTLQLLMYYILGLRSIHKELQKVRRLGIYNPRLNIVYLLEVEKISPEVVEAVTKDVLVAI